MTAQELEVIFDTLVDEYADWVKEQGLPHWSADELLAEDITPDQRNWLNAFMIRWEVMENEMRA